MNILVPAGFGLMTDNGVSGASAAVGVPNENHSCQPPSVLPPGWAGSKKVLHKLPSKPTTNTAEPPSVALTAASDALVGKTFAWMVNHGCHAKSTLTNLPSDGTPA